MNAQSWMLNQSIMDLGLDEIQVIKYPFVLHWKKHMNHGNIYQFHILWDLVKQDGRINDDPSHFGQKIDNMRRAQGSFGNTFHGDLEHGFFHI